MTTGGRFSYSLYYNVVLRSSYALIQTEMVMDDLVRQSILNLSLSLHVHTVNNLTE